MIPTEQCRCDFRQSLVGFSFRKKGKVMEQISFFEKNQYKIKKPLRLIELFAGYGSQALALKYLGVPFENYKISEWNVNSILAYYRIHKKENKEHEINKIDNVDLFLFEKGITKNNKETLTLEQIKRLKREQKEELVKAIILTNNLCDITKIKGKDLNVCDIKNYEYIMTYSFPCQDICSCGKRAGFKKNTNTRSSLLWEVERILNECENKPQILIMENSTQIHNSQNFEDFQSWLNILIKMGYNNFYQDMNACDYGIPQNRNRCFCVSILNGEYIFPSAMKLKSQAKDFLLDFVEKKYYLSNKMISFLSKRDKFFDKKSFQKAKAITTKDGNRWYSNFISDDGQKRRLTPIEQGRLMGLKDFDINNIKMCDTTLTWLFGNSIVVNVLIEIFKRFF